MITTMLNSAFEDFKNGNLENARKKLIDLLDVDPDNIKALEILGIIFSTQNDNINALECFNKIIKLQYSNAQAWSHHGHVLNKLKKPLEALRSFDKAINLNPELLIAWINRATTYFYLKRYDEALLSYQTVTKLMPDSAEAWQDMANTLMLLKRYQEARFSFEKAIKLKPEFFEAWTGLGCVLAELNLHVAALKSLDKALSLQPNYAEAWCNKGNVFLKLNKHEEAIVLYDTAIRLNPSYAGAWYDRGVALREINQSEQALRSFNEAISIQPDFAEAYFDKALTLLNVGNLIEGWDLYHWRWKSSSFNSINYKFEKPQWDGEQLDKKLLVWAEQGIGDQVLFGSILTDLSALATRPLVALDGRLIPLFQRSMPDCDFIDIKYIYEISKYDEQIPMGSLPKIFRPSMKSFANFTYPYLKPDQRRTEAYRKIIIQSQKIICGVSWSSKSPRVGKDKSVSLSDLLGSLINENLHFVNLQYGDTRQEREKLKFEHNIDIQDIESLDKYQDIDGLVSLIDACDVILTTSNVTAHLAGAIGKLTLLLLPFGRGQVWYWSHCGGSQFKEKQSLWYPSIRFYTQEKPGDWRSPLGEIKALMNDEATPSSLGRLSSLSGKFGIN